MTPYQEQQAMKRITHIPSIAALILSAIVAGCSSNPSAPAPTLHATVAGLPRIDQNSFYELWFSIPPTSKRAVKLAHGDHNYVRIAKFRVDESGNPVGLDGGTVSFTLPSTVNASLLEDALLTVEPISGNDSVPGARFLSGAFTGTAARGVAHMTPNGDDAFNDAFPENPSGYAILDAPTTADSSDLGQGIWFVHLDNGEVHPGLPLATLPTVDENPDWTYRAWLVHNNGSASAEYIPLGNFLSPDAIDDNGAGPFAGPLPNTIYAAPGEDFVATDHQRTLNDGTYGVVISLDPSGRNFPAPFLPLLTGPINLNTTGRLPFTLASAQRDPKIDIVVDR